MRVFSLKLTTCKSILLKSYLLYLSKRLDLERKVVELKDGTE